MDLKRILFGIPVKEMCNIWIKLDSYLKVNLAQDWLLFVMVPPFPKWKGTFIYYVRQCPGSLTPPPPLRNAIIQNQLHFCTKSSPTSNGHVKPSQKTNGRKPTKKLRSISLINRRPNKIPFIKVLYFSIYQSWSLILLAFHTILHIFIFY